MQSSGNHDIFLHFNVDWGLVVLSIGPPVYEIVADRITIDDELCANQRSLGCRNGPSKEEVSLDMGGKLTSGGAVSISGVQCYVSKHNDCLILIFFWSVNSRAWNAMISVKKNFRKQSGYIHRDIWDYCISNRCHRLKYLHEKGPSSFFHIL